MDEQEQIEQPIEEESPLEQRVIPFMGDELAAALTESGGIFISLPGMCNALGLNVRGQTQRIRRTKELLVGLRRIPLMTRGGRQEINCLRLDQLGLWLAGIETARVKGEFRAKIEEYHRNLAPVAIQVFLRMAGVSYTPPVPSGNPEIAALAAQIETLTAILTFLQEHMQSMLEATSHIPAISLKLDEAVGLLNTLVTRQDETEEKLQLIDQRTTRLTPAHARNVQERITQMVKQKACRSPSPMP
jgi:hypothetical protein